VLTLKYDGEGVRDVVEDDGEGVLSLMASA
jgi:hypothetical protein